MEHAEENAAALEELRQRNYFLNKVLSCLPDLTFIWDQDGRYLDYWAANPGLLLTPPEKLLGSRFNELLPPETAQLFESALQKCRNSGEAVSVEYSLSLPRGETYLEARICPVDHELFVVHIRDVSSRIETEQAETALLARQKRHQETIISIAKNENVAAGLLPEAFKVITELAANAICCERVSVWLLSEDRSTLRCSTLYLLSKGVHTLEAEVRAAHYPQYFETLTSDRVIDAHNARFDPRTAELADDYLIPNDITSMLDAVVRVGGEEVGVVCFEHTTTPRVWSSDEVAFAGEVADQVSQTLLNRERIGALRSLEESYAVLEERVRQRTAELRESELRFREVIENIREVFWMTDPSNRKGLFLSKAYEEVWGRSRESWFENAMSFLDVIHPDDRERVEKAMAKQTRGEFDEVYRIFGKDGAVRWIRDRAFPVRDDSGAVVRLAGIAEDITDAKVAEQQLQESQDFFSSIVDNLPLMIFVKEARNLSYIRLNYAGEQLLGLKSGDVIGKSDFDLFPAEQAAFFVGKDREVLDAGEMLDIPEEPVDTMFIGRRILHTKKIPLYDQDGRPAYLVGISEDITQRKNQELSLRRAERLASIGTLAAGIAHDINNPLGLIQLEAESLIRAGETGAEAKAQGLQKICEHVQRCSKIVRNILQFSREQTSDKKVCDVAVVVENAVRLTSRHAQRHLISIQPLIIDSDILVVGNAVELEQVLVNLLHNAIHASQTGMSVAVTAQRIGDVAQITVRDSGRGMSERELQQAMDPFFTTRQTEGGTGLGLSVCHGIISDHQGQLDIQSELDQGTEVAIRIPLYVSPPERETP